MIKVEHTKTHRIINSRNNFPNGQTIDYGTQVLVTDAELVLVKTHQYGGRISYTPKKEWLLNVLLGVPHDPILISRTEKIEEGDWYYCKEEGVILQADYKPKGEGIFKVLTLPEHFSPQQLKDIVDGKLKGKCLVECNEGGCLNYTENKTCKTPCDTPFCYYPSIKLNPHITIYPIEENMYTREEMIKNAFNFYYDMSNRMKVPFNLISENRTNAEEWFEQNVK